MDVISPPEVIEEIVTDVDLAFVNGVRSITLRGTDYLEYTKYDIIISMGEPVETIRVNRANLLWYSTRQRTIRRPVKKEKLLGS